MSELLFDESHKFCISNDLESKIPEMALFYMWVYDNDTSAASRTFFYGHQDIIPYIRTWLNHNPKFNKGQTMLLVLDADDKIKNDSDDTPTSHSLAGRALSLAIEKGEDHRSGTLVTLLLDNRAQHNPNSFGQTPLHFAVERGYVDIVERLLKKQYESGKCGRIKCKETKAKGNSHSR